MFNHAFFIVSANAVSLFGSRKYPERHYKVLQLVNALDIAEEFSQCNDVIGTVNVWDGSTGEILASYEEGKIVYQSDVVSTYFNEDCAD